MTKRMNVKNMQLSDKGKAHIKREEGVRLNAYLDQADVWTIGYGHTAAAGGIVPVSGMKITQSQANALFDQDIKQYVIGVQQAVKVPLLQHEFDMLVSFAFNLGVGSLRSSTMLKRINDGRHQDVPYEMNKWVNAGGKRNKGLIGRRAREGNIYKNGYGVSTGAVVGGVVGGTVVAGGTVVVAEGGDGTSITAITNTFHEVAALGRTALSLLQENAALGIAVVFVVAALVSWKMLRKDK